MSKDIYTCKICKKQFKSSQALNGHKRSHSSYIVRSVMCCSIYSKQEIAASGLDRHNNSYLKKLKQCIPTLNFVLSRVWQYILMPNVIIADGNCLNLLLKKLKNIECHQIKKWQCAP